MLGSCWYSVVDGSHCVYAGRKLKIGIGCYASLNQNIYDMLDPTSVDVDHAAHACCCIGALNVYSAKHKYTHSLKQMGRYASLNHNIYTTPVDVHAYLSDAEYLALYRTICSNPDRLLYINLFTQNEQKYIYVTKHC